MAVCCLQFPIALGAFPISFLSLYIFIYPSLLCTLSLFVPKTRKISYIHFAFMHIFDVGHPQRKRAKYILGPEQNVSSVIDLTIEDSPSSPHAPLLPLSPSSITRRDKLSKTEAFAPVNARSDNVCDPHGSHFRLDVEDDEDVLTVR